MQNLITSVLLLLLACLPLAANDWPQWRGPNRDDCSAEKGLLKQWPTNGPVLAWKTTGLGAGDGGVSVAGGRVFAMGDKDGAGMLFTFEEAGGKPAWSAKVGAPGGGPPGPRGTPTIESDRVYVLGQMGDLVCFDAAKGNEIWRKNLQRDFGGKCGGWKYSESPLVDGDKVICTPGGAQGTLIALNKQTGELLWQTKDLTDSAEYSSPVMAEIGKVRQCVQLTGAHVVGLDPKSGKVLWKAARQGRTATIPTPICYNDCVYVTSGYGVGCNLFRISSADGAFSAEEVYANKVMVDHHGGVVRVGEYLYGHSDGGQGWVCQEFKTGNLVWKDAGVGKGSVTYADGHLYLRSESSKGAIALVEATPEGYREKGRFNQPERTSEKSWPHPVIANGKLYIRDQDVLLCFDVKAK